MILFISGTKRRSEIEIISGAEGHSIAKVAVFETILHAPQILVDADGFEVVCFFTGSLTEKGAIFVISLHDLVLENEKKVGATDKFLIFSRAYRCD